MKWLLILALGIVSTWGLGWHLVDVEQRSYQVIEQEGDFELRFYPAAVVAETIVPAAFEEAGSVGFRILFAYISGANRTQQEITMTAPVIQQAPTQEIAMTAPVTQERVTSGSFRIAFMMPSTHTLETLPLPNDSRVQLREIDAQRFASFRYSGAWTRTNYTKSLRALRAWMEERGMESAGEPIWARYDAPFIPSFLRTNEILIPVRS